VAHGKPAPDLFLYAAKQLATAPERCLVIEDSPLGIGSVPRSRNARTEAHFARIRAGRVESVETSALHLDLLRDLKRINAHIAAAAYPVLEKRGELLSSRLRQDT
jgi:hypothetical protein